MIDLTPPWCLLPGVSRPVKLSSYAGPLKNGNIILGKRHGHDTRLLLPMISAFGNKPTAASSRKGARCSGPGLSDNFFLIFSPVPDRLSTSYAYHHVLLFFTVNARQRRTVSCLPWRQNCKGMRILENFRQRPCRASPVLLPPMTFFQNSLQNGQGPESMPCVIIDLHKHRTPWSQHVIRNFVYQGLHQQNGTTDAVSGRDDDRW